MADRKMGILTEQRAESGRKSKLLQEVQPAAETSVSGFQSEVQSTGRNASAQNPSMEILASSASRESLNF